jgi:hypothetical protein
VAFRMALKQARMACGREGVWVGSSSFCKWGVMQSVPGSLRGGDMVVRIVTGDVTLSQSLAWGEFSGERVAAVVPGFLAAMLFSLRKACARSRRTERFVLTDLG